MKKTTRFERSATVRCGAEAVHAELADPQRHVGLHPLLTSVLEVPKGGSEGIRSFEAVEAMRVLGWIPWKNRIRLRMESSGSDEVLEFEARSIPGIVVRSRFTVSQAGAETLVREEVEVDSPHLIHAYVTAEAVRAQEALLANLKRRLEARGTTR